MLEATQMNAVNEVLAAVSDTLRAAYELGAVNVHIFAEPDFLKAAIVADEAFGEPFAAAYPEYPLVPVPAVSDQSKPMYLVFFPIPTLAEDAASAVQGQGAVETAEAIVAGAGD